MNTPKIIRSFARLTLLLPLLGITPLCAGWLEHGGSYDGSYSPNATTPPSGQSIWSKAGSITPNSPAPGIATFSDPGSGVAAIFMPISGTPEQQPAENEYSFHIRLRIPSDPALNVQANNTTAAFTIGFKNEGVVAGALTGKTVLLGWFNGTPTGQHVLALTNNSGGLGTFAVTVSTANYFDDQFHDYHVRKYRDAEGVLWVQVYVDGVPTGSAAKYDDLAAASNGANGFGVFTTGAGKAAFHLDELQFGTATPERISVRAYEEVSTRGRDDHGLLRSFFNSASIQQPINQNLIESVFAPLGANSARAINVDIGSDISGTTFVPRGQLSGVLASFRRNGWKPHLIVGQHVPGLSTQPSLPANVVDWNEATWTAYRAYARAYVAYVASHSSARQLVADSFHDGEFLNNPTWTPHAQSGSNPWSVADSSLVAPLAAAQLYPSIGLPFVKLESDSPVYVSFEVRNPYPASDYQPIVFSLTNPSSAGYSFWGNPHATVYGGNSGFASSSFGSSPNAVGVVGAALGTVQNRWDKILVKIDPVANTLLMTCNGQTVATITNAFLVGSLDQFRITNRSQIPWRVRNVYIGHKPADTGGDNFDAGNLNRWDVVAADPSHPWSVGNGFLILPSGSTQKPRISLDLTPAPTSEPWQISLDIKYPSAPADYQPVAFTLVQKGVPGAPTDKAYNIWANPRANVYGGVSGFAHAPITNFDATTRNTAPFLPSHAGVPGEALGRYSYYDGASHWERLLIRLDSDNYFRVYRNDRLVLSFHNALGLAKIDRFQISNQGQAAWRIDNVYSWYGDNALPEILLEVENEPDLVKPNSAWPRWWIPTGQAFTMGGQVAFDNYFRLYQVWADAVADFTQADPRPMLIAGPAASAGTFVNNYPINWLTLMAEESDDTDTRLDMLTMHFYGENGKIAGRPTPRFPAFGTQLESLKEGAAHLADRGPIKVGITEWGPSYNVTGDLESPGVINGNNIGAAWAASFVIEMLDTGVDAAVMLVYQNFLKNGSTEENHTWPAFYTKDGTFPRPLYNLARMFQEMPGVRCPVDFLPAQGAGVGAYATTAGPEEMAVMVYNYDWSFTQGPSYSIPRRGLVYLEGGEADATYDATPWVIDATRGNSGQYCENGVPIQMAGSALVAGDPIAVTASAEGTIRLPAFDLPPSSVTLWKLTKQQ